MATISTHTLNSVDGTHAGGIPVSVVRIGDDGQRAMLLSGETDDGGRFVHEIDPSEVDGEATHELVLQIGPYFDERGLGDPQGRAMQEVVVRFQMPDPHGRYHIPFMLAPNSYSVWSSR